MAALIPPSVPIGCEQRARGPSTLPLRPVALDQFTGGAANGRARRWGNLSGAANRKIVGGARGAGGVRARARR